MDIPEEIALTIKSLTANGFDARFAQTRLEAKEIMLEMISQNALVGVADSVTLRQIGVLEALAQRGNEIINPFVPEMTAGIKNDPVKRGKFINMMRKTFGSDVFVTGSNAVTMDGNIVNIDRNGNRVAGIIYAAPKVILAVGRNKIAKDVNAAIDRIKNVLAPAHTKQKGYKTPCAAKGKCYDCDSPDRVCNITVILEKKPLSTDLSIVVVNEDLGLGWDPEWDETRVAGIRDDYYRYSWPF
jgi:L-lactate utilization protein LutB